MIKQTALVRTKNGVVQVKWFDSKDFIPVASWFGSKSIDEVIPLLKELPANKNTDFIKVE